MYARRFVKFALVTVSAMIVIGPVQAHIKLAKQKYLGGEGVKELCALNGDSKGTLQVKGEVPIGGGAIKSDSELVEIDFKVDNCGSTSVDLLEQPTIKECTFTTADPNSQTVKCDPRQASVPDFMFKGKKDAEPKPYTLCCWMYSGCYLKPGKKTGICKS